MTIFNGKIKGSLDDDKLNPQKDQVQKNFFIEIATMKHKSLRLRIENC